MRIRAFILDFFFACVSLNRVFLDLEIVLNLRDCNYHIKERVSHGLDIYTCSLLEINTLSPANQNARNHQS
jgi:hypothetical protein